MKRNHRAAYAKQCKLRKKPRIPLDLSLAAAVSHAVPMTNALKLGPLLSAPPVPVEATKASPAGATTLAESAEQRMLGFARWVEGPINQYGAPYMLVHWASGLATFVGTAALVHHGVDIVAVLRQLPFVPSVSDSTTEVLSGRASCLAGAMLINSLSLPVRIYLMSVLARPAFVSVSAWHDASARLYRSHLRQQMRSSPDFPRRLEVRSR